eukprot:jgi/Chlat1/3397/Chrsp23S03735
MHVYWNVRITLAPTIAYLILQPSHTIHQVCSDLVREGAFHSKPTVAHCSGALTSHAALGAAASAGCLIASAHPLLTFPDADAGVRRLPGAYWFCEGSPEALAVVKPLVTAVKGRYVEIEAQRKVLYHAAAVMASNYTVTLLDMASSVAAEAGIDRRLFMTAVEPLVQATVDNVFRMGATDALTGPIARGDVDTVRAHLAALRLGRKLCIEL